MAEKLIACPACGREISAKAAQCPHCGHRRKKPILKRWWVWIIIVLLILMAAVGSNGSNPKSAAPSTTTSPVPAAVLPVNEPTDVAPEEPSNLFYVGDTAETSHFSIAYEGCDSDWKGYDQYFGPSDGNKIIRAYFTFENISSSDYSCGSFDFDCYADGVACDAYIWSSDSSLSYASLSPGRKLQGYICYEVPIDAEVIELEYETSFWTQNKIIFMVE